MIELPQHLQQIIVLGISLLLLVLLFIDKLKPSAIFFSVILVFIFFKIITPKELLDNIANESIIGIFLLIFITSGIRNHFNILKYLDAIIGTSTNINQFNLKLSSIVVTVSSVLNNTPIVAFFMPYVYQWSKKNNVAPSKLLLPLSFAAIIGGMITVVGTSTNMVLNGLIQTKDAKILGFMDYIYPGLLVSFFGVLFIYFFGDKLLPNRKNLVNEINKNARKYIIETRVNKDSNIINKSISEAKLRNLSGVYLFEIVRNNRQITPVEPDEIIHEGDALFFAGDTDNILDLIENVKGLSLPINPTNINKDDKHSLVEAVIPSNSKLVGNTLKQIEFREQYDAAVVAIHRNGEKMRGKIGEIEMQAGDLLLISKGKNFENKLKDDTSLYLVSVINKVSNAKSNVRWGFLAVIIAVILALIFAGISLFLGLLIIMAYMLFSGLLTIPEIKKEFDFHLFIILICSLCFSTAIINTGSAQIVAKPFLELAKNYGNVGVVVGVFLVTLLLTTFVTHVATVSIIFPIAYELSVKMPEINSSAIFLAIAFAASASFHAPFSYQTNLMIYGPGNYRVKDYLIFGLPFTLLYSIVTLVFLITFYNI